MINTTNPINPSGKPIDIISPIIATPSIGNDAISIAIIAMIISISIIISPAISSSVFIIPQIIQKVKRFYMINNEAIGVLIKAVEVLYWHLPNDGLKFSV